ncbi:MAG: hypothetical protein O7C63_06780 [Alphaproteobacteria bacterium]|nr:hypothetical protein [Alphaproteobacteria bacterium]
MRNRAVALSVLRPAPSYGLAGHVFARHGFARHGILVALLSIVGVSLAACQITDGIISVADKMSEPFLSLLTGEDLGDVSTDPLYAYPDEPELPPPLAPIDTGFGRPLVVLRAGASPQNYRQPLDMAIGRALAVRPDMYFDVVAVAPTLPDGETAGPSRSELAVEDAATIMQTLMRHGVAPANIAMNVIADPAATGDGEVHIYVR